MNKKAEIILRKYKGKQVGVFIDDANMFHTQREVGWFIDWQKFRGFLDKNFKVKFVKYYRGVYPGGEKISEEVEERHRRYGQILERTGFEVIHRVLKKIYLDKTKTKFIYKCDFDAEVGFDVALNLRLVDLVILVSGDSDFVCLSNKLATQKKSFLMVCFDYKAPWEVRRIHHLFLEDIKEKIIFAKRKPGF